MKPDFKAMSRKELRAYILQHRDDDEAFYAYMDKLQAEATWVEFPAPKSIAGKIWETATRRIVGVGDAIALSFTMIEKAAIRTKVDSVGGVRSRR